MHKFSPSSLSHLLSETPLTYRRKDGNIHYAEGRKQRKYGGFTMWHEGTIKIGTTMSRAISELETAESAS